MKLQDQVCTLEQAKRLKELGVKQEGLFSYVHEGEHYCGGEKVEAGQSELIGGCSQCLDFPYKFDGVAFTVAELGEMLSQVRYKAWGFPMMFTSYCHSDDFVADTIGKWNCSFRNPRDFKNPEIKASTEAEARAAMLIYLIENKLLTPNLP